MNKWMLVLAIVVPGGSLMAASLLLITAGGLVYLAAADLIPELQHDRSLRASFTQTILISMGIAVMGLLTLIE
jgi:zinc transporter ZupT